MIIMSTDRRSCIDLRATFGKQFRYAMDPAYDIEVPAFRAEEKAWLTRIPCRYGFIYPYGKRRLAAYTTTRRLALAALPCVTVVQGGNIERESCPEVVVTFDAADIQVVADLLGARRPPMLSPEERERRAEQMRKVLAERRAGVGGTTG